MTRVLKNATLIDGTGKEPVANAVIVIDGERISAVGREGEIAQPPGEAIDLAGKTVLPGLINAHDHLTWRRSYGPFAERAANQPAARLLVRGVGQSLIALAEGNTTVRDLAAKEKTNIALKMAIEEGITLGPRIVTCGETICMTGGHGDSVFGGVDGADAVRKAAREQLRAGADLVKVMASGGFVSQGIDQPTSLQLTVEEMHAAFEEAHKAGRKTTVHAHPPVAIQAAIEAGVDCIEHGGLLDDETAELMASKGIFLVPTLSASLVTAQHGLEMGRPQWLVDVCRESADSRMENYRRAVRAGVKIVAGVDSVGDVAGELELLMQGGLTSMEAIQAATRTAAECLDMSDMIGTVEVGKWADLIVIDGDPLVDITVLRNIEVVIKGGVIYDPDRLRSSLGPALMKWVVG
jgi:imidazolonepropionase-like amidohydrolase